MPPIGRHEIKQTEQKKMNSSFRLLQSRTDNPIRRDLLVVVHLYYSVVNERPGTKKPDYTPAHKGC